MKIFEKYFHKNFFFAYRKNKFKKIIQSMKWAVLINLPLLMMCFCSKYWLPRMDSSDDFSSMIQEEHTNGTYSGKAINNINRKHKYD